MSTFFRESQHAEMVWGTASLEPDAKLIRILWRTIKEGIVTVSARLIQQTLQKFLLFAVGESITAVI